ncbi:MAG: hypothetical protein ACE5GF_07010 [Thermodesulfobacteriota bacterium]
MSGYSQERLLLLNRLIEEGRAKIPEGKPWILDPSHMRFSLGESVSELKIPYSISADDEKVIGDSILSLVLLLKLRVEGESGKEGEGEKIDTEKLELKTPLTEKSFRTDMFISHSSEKRLVTEMVRQIPFLDSGLLRSWLVIDGYGMAYLNMVVTILEKAAREETRCEKGEKTTYLALLAIINATRCEKEFLKRFDIKGITYERLEITVGLAHFFLLQEAVNELIRQQKQGEIPNTGTESEDLITSALMPGATVLIPFSLLSHTMNPYGITQEAVTLLTPVYEMARERARSTFHHIDLMVKAVKRDSALHKKLIDIAKVIGLREKIMGYLLNYDSPALDVHKELQEVCQNDRLLMNLIGDARKIGKLNRELDEMKSRYERDRARIESLEMIQGYLSAVRRPSVFGWFSGRRVDSEELLRDIVGGFITYTLDTEIGRYVTLMRNLLVDRRGEFSGDVLKSEYAKGRLYRFSSDKSAFIKELELKDQGYLFVDMKDFTRKTFKVKEIAMAEFMRVNFYLPILEAASRYKRGAGLLEDERGIQLDNLLGDAAVFSGGVTSLVSLARDIQKITLRYRDELGKRLPLLYDEKVLSTIHENYGRVKEEIKPEEDEAETAIARGDSGGKARLLRLKEKESRVETNYREELEEAIKTEMESGLFITYGKKAEDIIIQGKKDFCQESKVAIGEKINEAARGTYRSSVVRAKLEMALEGERKRRGRPELRYPFDIYIDKTYSIIMTPEMDSTIEELIANRDMSSAKEFAKVVADQYYDDLKMIASGAPLSSVRLLRSATDIYNKGQALSEDALKAYMAERRGVMTFFRRSVAVSELHDEFRDAFFFPSDPLDLWLAVEVGEGNRAVELFTRIGEVTFKGFEKAHPTVVYEIVNREGEFFKLVIEHHFDTWRSDAKSDTSVPSPD